MLADARPEWLTWIVEPLAGDPRLAPMMIGVFMPLALLLAAVLFFWVRRAGAHGGALTFEGMTIGLPLALAVFLLPYFIVPMTDPAGSGVFNPERSLQLGLVQMLLTGAAIVILYRNPLERADAERPRWLAARPRDFRRTALAWLLAVPALQSALIAGVAGMRLQDAAPAMQPILSHLTSDRGAMRLLGAYVLAVGGAPLSEEFIFRLVLYGGLRRLVGSFVGDSAGHWIALVLSVTVFVAVHGVFAPGQWYLVAPLTVLSVALTLTYAHTRSLWPCVFFHALHNAFALTLALMN